MDNGLIIWSSFDYILLFILGFLPLIYKVLFWLYTIQLKEYRWDRFKEYLLTKQWKSAIFNVFFVVEFILFIFSIFIYCLYLTENIYTSAFYWLFYNVFFWFLVIENIFVFWKILRRRIIKPKITWRIIILWLLFVIWWSIDLYYFINLNLFNFVYIYILLIFISIPFIIFFYNFISLPLVNYLKNKKINAAINKSKKIKKPIKIWITWSYWKSSVKEFLASILEQDWETLKTPENINTELWVSAIILNKLTNKYKYFVAEMWAYKIGEIDILGQIVDHKFGFLTAIWNQHIWLFWNQENIIKWKFEILNKVIENKWFLYVNNDNSYINNYLKTINNSNIITYWIDNQHSIAQSKIIEIINLNTKFNFSYKWISEDFETNLIWKHNILNLTWILAFCYDIWFKTKDLKKYLLNIKSPKNTGEIIKSNNNILIDDTYNLSEAWLKSGLELLQYFKNNKKILILDDILELGKDADKIHYELWQNIAKNKLTDNIYYIWINYKQSFEKWLIEWWFNKKWILLDINNISKNSVILFEWRNTKKYLNKLNK